MDRKPHADLPTNRSMPTSTVIPVLAYPEVRAAVDWLCGAFGFVERLRIGDHRSQLNFGDGSVVVTGGRADAGTGHSVMIRVTDIDAHHERAKRFGAQIFGPPTDFPYGERQYSAQDLAGHAWTFSQSIANVDPASWGGVLSE